MPSFRTLDHVDVNGKRVLVRVDLNVPIERRQGHRRDPHRAHGADHHRDRRQGRQGDPALPFRPAEGPRSEGRSLTPVADEVARRHRAAGLVRRGLRRRAGRGRGRRARSRRRPAAWRTPASTRARKRTTRPSSRSWPRSATSMSTTRFSAAHRAHASTEGLARKLPAYAGRSHAGRARRARARRWTRRSVRWPRSSAAPRSPPSSTCSAT